MCALEAGYDTRHIVHVYRELGAVWDWTCSRDSKQCSMAGDSETRLQDQEENGNAKPFIIGVSGGTASGKVRILYTTLLSFLQIYLFPFAAIYDGNGWARARASAAWLLF